MKTIPLLALLIAAANTLPAEASDYAGQQTRPIKALSASEISGYRAGHGMGLARPAELNGYPGPRHVLDLAAGLKLTPAQIAGLNRIFAAMHAAALPLGERIITKETELDRLFATQSASDGEVSALTAAIARLQGELRAVHLNAHIATSRLLSPDQIASYNRLRGYFLPSSPAQAH